MISMEKLRIYSLFLLLGIFLVGCKVIGDIFSAGFFTGLVVVVLIVGLIIFIVAKASKK